MSTMLKTRLYTIVVGCCVIVIVFGIHSFVPSFPNQWTYFSQPIAKQRSDMNTNFSPELPNPNCSLSGYILVHRYAGQQAGGVKSLVSLQRWVRDVGLPMMIVEPFIQDSFLGTYRESLQEIKFSDMFDLEKFNRVSHSDGIAELIPWEAYANNCAFVHAVLVRIHQTSTSVPPKVVWDARPGSSDCWPQDDNRHNIAIHKGPLCYVRVVDYFRQHHNSSNSLPARDVCNILLAGLELGAVNLVFNTWSMGWRSPDAHPRPRSVSSLHSYSTSYEKNGSAFLSDNLQDSPHILLDVKNYQEQFLSRFDGSSYVAVMLRIEYVIMKQKRVKGSLNFTQLQDTLNETMNVTTMVMAELGIKDVFVTADIGLYGSLTWRSKRSGERARVEERIKHTVEKLYKNKWTFEEWEKSFAQATGGVKDRGYIAAVQRGIASRASCMILVGGGAFQALTLRNYIALTESHKRCIHFVSAKQSFSDVEKLYALKNT